MRWLAISLTALALPALFGCGGKSAVRGQRPPPAAGMMFSDVERQTCVLFPGPVRNRAVPWVDGLTLAQSLVAANYLGANDPRLIILRRDGVPTEIHPAELLAGEDILVAPGDVVEIIP
jgi:hypothetical protein